MKKIMSCLFSEIVLTSTVYAETFNVTRMDDPVPDGCNVNGCSLRGSVCNSGAVESNTIFKDGFESD